VTKVAVAFAYYDEHPQEIDEWVERNRRAAGDVHAEWQARRS
jgi:hypothetical protein